MKMYDKWSYLYLRKFFLQFNVFMEEYMKGLKGHLITNGFLQTQKFSEIQLWLMEAAKKHGIELVPLTNDKISILPGSNQKEEWSDSDFILFWDKDIRLAKYLEQNGKNLINSAKSIELCDDKSLTHLVLQANNIKMPKTIVAPMTFPNIGYTQLDFLEVVERKLSYPIIIKECFGSFGQQVYIVSDYNELVEKTRQLQGKPLLYQEFIKSSAGKDIRLQVVGNQVVAAMYRYSENGDFRANITNGGKMKYYEPTKEQVDLAVRSCKVLGLDFGGVDILFGENQEPIVCEVNSNAHFKNIYDCTGVNVADSIMEYIIKKICIG